MYYYLKLQKMANILVCDDEIMMRRTLEYRLKADGHVVVAVSDGIKANDLVAHQGANIHLIITDLMMPYMNGLELINLVRNQYHLKTPIIVLSKVSNEDSVIEALEMGADEYITKPFSPNELSLRIKKLLART